jgi:hypothetical protein
VDLRSEAKKRVQKRTFEPCVGAGALRPNFGNVYAVTANQGIKHGSRFYEYLEAVELTGSWRQGFSGDGKCSRNGIAEVTGLAPGFTQDSAKVAFS